MSAAKPDITTHLVQIYTPVFIKQPKSETKSILIQAVIKYQHMQGGLDNLIYQLDFDSFCDEDFKHQTVKEKKIMPLAERWFYAYMKIVLAIQSEPEFERNCEKAGEILKKAEISYRYPFCDYYNARFLMKAKKMKEAIEKAKKFLLQNTTKAYAWELLAECKETNEEKIPLLAKAIDLNKKSPEFSLTSRKRIMEIFLRTNKNEFAALTAETIIAIRQRNQWPIPEYLNIEQPVKQNYTNAEVEFISRINEMSRQIIETVLDEKMKKYAVVSGFDAKSGIRYFLTEDGSNLKTKGFGRVMMGDLCYIWVNGSNIVHLEIKKPIPNINMTYIKIVKGRLKSKESYGFVEGVYVSAGLLKGHRDGDEVSFLCIKEKNRKTEKLDWRAIKLL